ncbi:MAG: hypothetical protein WCQ91_01935 [Planctomycetota bacterium]
MTSPTDPTRIPDDRITIERRHDGAIIVRVRSVDLCGNPLSDAVFAFRCGDPQHAYWLSRLNAASTNTP